MYTYTQFWWSTKKKFPSSALQLVTAGHKGVAIFHISRTLCGILAVPSNAVFCSGLTLTNILKWLIQDLPCIQQLATNWYSKVNYFTDSILLSQNYNIWSSSLCFVVALYVKSPTTSESYPSPTHSGADAHTIYLLCPSRSHHIIPNESFWRHCHVSSYTLFARVWRTHQWHV